VNQLCFQLKAKAPYNKFVAKINAVIGDENVNTK
jgi:hypothetical protein